ncbi:peptide deformylase [Legionella parisiensis]|uniref:Peptide deformylase n=1 Tax=Legionella parisiensis TaxID=45071 RepID=A0A1E5JSE1_9GAMM|nr:peptide deformylase [Legionella parisiensis]KTD42176.1 polypeptide deformylase [Legionella parisiensis]OEH47437.1 Peptide deformylase [Legionella parisiensis]STX75235.1 polypeptide deformylase [Legionella parisiensis]
MAMDIVTVEQPEYRQVLKSKAQEVQFPLSHEDKELIAAMKIKLHGLGGVGLAAPQVNCAKRIIAIYIPEEVTLLRDNVKKFYPMHIMINPSYEPIEGSDMHQDFEGCYSVSSKSGKVPRYEQITLTYYDESGHFHQQTEEGFYARVLQHEIDHLNGFLILDRLTPDCIQGSVEEMMALRRELLSPEKRALFDQMIARKAQK